jgi:hypothetical protein
MASSFFFVLMLLYCLLYCILSRQRDDSIGVWISLSLCVYSVVCCYIVSNYCFVRDCSKLLNVLGFVVTYGSAIFTCGILFGGWQLLSTLSFQWTLCSVWMFVYNFHEPKDTKKVDVVFVESTKKRITFFEIE